MLTRSGLKAGRALALALPLALPLGLVAGALFLAPAPAQASEVPPPRSGEAPSEDIVVTARRRRVPDLQETQEFNAEELARLRAEFEPPPARTPRAYEAERGVATRTAGVRSMIEQSPRLRDIEIPR